MILTCEWHRIFAWYGCGTLITTPGIGAMRSASVILLTRPSVATLVNSGQRTREGEKGAIVSHGRFPAPVACLYGPRPLSLDVPRHGSTMALDHGLPRLGCNSRGGLVCGPVQEDEEEKKGILLAAFTAPLVSRATPTQSSGTTNKLKREEKMNVRISRARHR